MTNIRELVANGLLTITDNVKMTKPAGDIILPLICYSETSNITINIASDRIKYRVAVYASTFEELLTLTDDVDALMSDVIGMTRTAITPDADAKIGTDLFLKRIDYAVTINTAENYIIRQNK